MEKKWILFSHWFPPLRRTEEEAKMVYLLFVRLLVWWEFDVSQDHKNKSRSLQEIHVSIDCQKKIDKHVSSYCPCVWYSKWFLSSFGRYLCVQYFQEIQCHHIEWTNASSGSYSCFIGKQYFRQCFGMLPALDILFLHLFFLLSFLLFFLFISFSFLSFFYTSRLPVHFNKLQSSLALKVCWSLSSHLGLKPTLIRQQPSRLTGP